MSGTVTGASAGSLVLFGYLSTQGSQIVDVAGSPVRIASVGWNQIYTNVSGIISENVAAIKAADVNAIRVSWVNATIDEDLSTSDQIVAAAMTHDMKIILDNHTTERGTPDDG